MNTDQTAEGKTKPKDAEEKSPIATTPLKPTAGLNGAPVQKQTAEYAEYAEERLATDLHG